MNKNYKGNITPKEIIKEIKVAKNIVLTVHINPDGDALGSVLASLPHRHHRGQAHGDPHDHLGDPRGTASHARHTALPSGALGEGRTYLRAHHYQAYGRLLRSGSF